MGKQKVVITSLSSLLLVAMVIGVTISITKKNNGTNSIDAAPATGSGNVNANAKAVQAICAPTNYKETCEQSLANTNTTDPKELIKVAFEATLKSIGDALKNSTLLKEAAQDSGTKDAFKVCEETLQTSIEDMQKSSNRLQEFDVSKLDTYVEDVRTWLSSVITYQDTCIDAFENTTGNTAEKVKNLLKTTGELSSNSLAMVTDFTKILGSLQLGGFTSSRSSTSRRLLEDSDATPSFVNAHMKAVIASDVASLNPDLVVAQDGSGKFKTIADAINNIPAKNNKTFVIYIKAGVYKEYVIVPKNVKNIVFIGDGPKKTVITGNKNVKDGGKTFYTATLAVDAENFIAKDIAVENTAGPVGEQAVAVRVSADKAIFHNVEMNGYQDTLYAHTNRQFYSNCTISGTIDFIFGNALSIFQKCRFVVRKPMEDQACMVTAQGRKDQNSNGAIVIQGGEIVAEPAFLSVQPPIDAYLGRPWKEYSRTIIMQANIDGFIKPEGWSPWGGNFALDTCYYGEYQNTGAGSSLAKRVTWKGIKKITPQIAQSFKPTAAFVGDDQWIKASGVPYVPGML